MCDEPAILVPDLARKAVALGNGVRILIRSSDPRLARALQDRFAEADQPAMAFAGPTGPAPRGPPPEDVTIVIEADVATAMARAAELAPDPARLALAVAALTAAGPILAGFDGFDAIDVNAPPAALRRRIAALWRVGLARDELAARRATMSALGFPAAPRAPEADAPPRLLFVGRPDPYFLALERAAGAAGASILGALTTFAAFDHLHDERFDAVIVNGAVDPGPALSLCGALRRNTDLATLPAMVACTPDAEAATVRDAAERGADVIDRGDGPPQAALSWLIREIKAERRRRQIDADLGACLATVAEPRSRLANPLFIERHVETLAARHHASGRALSVAAIRLSPAPGASVPHPAAWTRTFADAAGVAARLIRTADTGAVWDDDTLILALPALDERDARAALDRIVAVGECTAFASEPAGPLEFNAHAATLAPGESGAGLLARALGGLSRWAAHA